MRYSAKQYALALHELLSDAKTPAAHAEVVKKFATALSANGDTKLVDDIGYHFEKLRQKKEGSISVHMTTPSKNAVEFPKNLDGKKVELTVTEDPSLLAGAIVTVGDYRIDNSVRERLKKLSETIQ